MEVLQILAKGYSDDEIAEQLCLSNVTMHTHISWILAKLGLKNRVQASLYVVSQMPVPGLNAPQTSSEVNHEIKSNEASLYSIYLGSHEGKSVVHALDHVHLCHPFILGSR